MKLTEQHKLLLISVLQDSLRIKDGEMFWVLNQEERKKLYADILKKNEGAENE